MEQNNYSGNAPYIRRNVNVSMIMLYVIVALIPAGIYGVWKFGIHAAEIILVTCAAAVVTEWIFEKITKKPVTVKEFRGLLNGLLISYCLPPTVEWYVAVLAGILCAMIMQLSIHLFYKNIVSPVILTRLILMFLCSDQMCAYAVDGLTSATPLGVLKVNGTVDTLKMIIGNTGGCIGETSALLLCLGAIFLIMKGILDFRVSGMYLFSFAAFLAVFGGYGLDSYYLTAQLAGGGFMLTLWYIAPAYSTIPITKKGRWIYGSVLGILTGIFRLYGSSAENLCYAVLLANILVPFIEKLTLPSPFGVEKGQL